MRNLILCCLSVFLLAACKKNEQAVDSTPSVIKNLMHALRDSMPPEDFALLNFDGVVITSVDSVQLFIARVPFKSEEIDKHFILAHITGNGDLIQGRRVKLSGKLTRGGMANTCTYEGFITIGSLNGQHTTHSTITNGYIDAFLPARKKHREAFMQPSGGLLPDVVVVGYLSSESQGIEFSTWLALMNLFNNNSSWSYSTYYSAIQTAVSYGGGGSTSSYNGSPLAIDFENQYSDPPIDLEKYINCFNAIPDAGAKCTIEIFTDIPVDSDPNRLFDWQIGSPGHTFLQIKKSNGSQTVQQSIGFYPESGWKTGLTNAPIKGKFVDNGGHEFNASLKMNITPEQLKLVLLELQYFKNSRYDIDEFNCTDWALAIFNAARPRPLEIPLYNIPGGLTAAGTSTPQGLYNRLKELKNSGSPEAANIVIGISKGYVGGSKGSCN